MEDANLGSGLLNIGLALLVVAGVLVGLLRRERSRRTDRENFLAGLGFTPALPAPELLARLDRLYRRQANQIFKLSEAYQKTTGQGVFTLFSLNETSNNETTSCGDGSLAVFSDDLRLPHFHIQGRMQFPGKTSQWMVSAAEKVVDWAAAQGGYERLDLAEFPEIDTKLMVLAQDEEQARQFLTRDRLARLTWLSAAERLSELDGDGDLFVLKRSARANSLKIESDVPAMVDDAQRAWVALT